MVVLQLLLRDRKLKQQQNHLQTLLCSEWCHAERWLVGPSDRELARTSLIKVLSDTGPSSF